MPDEIDEVDEVDEITVSVWRSAKDGIRVVQIDTSFEPSDVGLRVYVNEELVSDEEGSYP